MTREIVGRENELTELEEILRAKDALPGAIMLDGEAGIGKTTLWRRATEIGDREGYRILAASPAEQETQLAFTAAGDLLSGADDVFSALPAPQRRALGSALLLEDVAGPPPDLRAVSLAFLGALRELARGRPLLVAVDDVQWLDSASAFVLEFSLRRVESDPIAFLFARRGRAGTRRPLGLDQSLAGAVRLLSVGPLSLGALHRLLRIELGRAFPRPLLRRIHEASGGNPFYALELGRHLAAREGGVDPGGPLPVPESLQDLVRERIAAQPVDVRKALAAVAALSRPTVFAVGADAPLDVAVEAGLIEVDGDRVRFSHPLLAAEAYGALGVEERRKLHRRLAASVSDVEERARHLALSANEPDEETAEALDQAAARAALRGASDAAGELAERAAQLTPSHRSPDARRRLVDAAFYHFESGDSQRARALLEETITVLAAGPARARALVRLARVRGYDDDLEAAADLFLQALTETGDDQLVRAEAHEGVSATFFKLRERLPEAADHAEAAAKLAAGLGHAPLLGESLSTQLVVEAILGRDRAAATLRAALDAQPVAEHVRALAQPAFAVAVVSMWSDDHGRARELLEHLLGRASELGDESSLPYLLAILTQVECLVGDYSAARRHADEGQELAEQAGQESLRAYHLALRALVAAHTGDVEAARADAVESLATASRTNARPAEHFATTALGLLELSLGRPAEAVAVLRPLAAFMRREGIDEPGVVTRFAIDQVEALVELGEGTEAADVLDWYEANAVRLGRHSALANAARCRGLCCASNGDLDGALVAFDHALAEHDRVTLPFDRARTLLALGATHRRLRHKRRGRETLESALGIFEQLGTPLWSEKTRAELARIGGRARSTGELTPTEQRVAELVAEGRSNKEVARELFVSVRTVEANLSKIYAKLGIRSRTQLAHRLHG